MAESTRSRGAQVMREQMYRTKIAFLIACVFVELLEQKKKKISAIELAEIVGCSRANAWRHITQLQLEGFIDLIILEDRECSDGVSRGNLVVGLTGHHYDVLVYYDYTYQKKWLEAGEERLNTENQSSQLRLVA